MTRLLLPLIGQHDILLSPETVAAGVSLDLLGGGAVVIRLRLEPGASALALGSRRGAAWGRPYRCDPPHPGPDGAARLTLLCDGSSARLRDGVTPLGSMPLRLPPDPVVEVELPAGVRLTTTAALPSLAAPAAASPGPAPPAPEWPALPNRFPGPDEYGGAFDQADERGLRGWVLAPVGHPEALRVEAIVDGEVVAHSYAILPRSDLAESGRDSRCGFRLTWSRFDQERVSRLAGTVPDAPVRITVPAAGGVLPALVAPTVRALETWIGGPSAPPPEPLEAYEEIADSGIFDAPWYVRRYAPPGDALSHYLEIGEAAGHQPCLYLEPWRVAQALGLSGLRGALRAYRAAPERVPVPGLHFHAAWFAAVQDVPPGRTPLGHFLAHRRALSPNPHLDVPLYRRLQGGLPDVADPYEHFLDRATTGRDAPNPDFDARLYAETVGEAAARDQPFLHRLRAATRRRRAPPLPSAEGERVSVVVPNYRYARFIVPRLASIFAQTHPPHEVIVLDDASPDRSVEVIEAAAAHNGWPIRLVASGTNSGNVQRQWRAGLDLCGGDLVWIAEADDLSDPRFLETLVAALRDDPGAILGFTDSTAIDPEGRVTRPDHKAYFRMLGDGTLLEDAAMPAERFRNRFLYPRNLLLNVSSALWRRGALERAFEALGEEAYDFVLAGDWRLYAAACGFGGTVHYRAAPLNQHRAHDGSVRERLDRPAQLAEIRRMHGILAPLVRPDEEARNAAESFIRHLETHWKLAPADTPPIPAQEDA
ncbi:glycosyltransferase family 2 protein [Muricoccus radiodurans]|uniref:glycosyltransferase family 2 protein n=1 Tax=Muricoccus radiodurans TaxID=2231721 RepID=UPI003CEEC82F